MSFYVGGWVSERESGCVGDRVIGPVSQSGSWYVMWRIGKWGESVSTLVSQLASWSSSQPVTDLAGEWVGE